jgi:hypothetical protein
MYNFTLVTAFYEVRSKRTPLQYFFWIAQFFTNYQGHLVVFTESKFAGLFAKWRRQFSDKTRIIIVPKDEWVAQKQFPARFWEHQYQLDHETFHSPELYMVWYQKNVFVQQTILVNPFNHTKFMWCDAGIIRKMQNKSLVSTMHLYASSRILEDKMTLLQINPFKEDENESAVPLDFQFRGDRMGAGIFAGGIQAWQKWIARYNSIMMQCLQKGYFVGKEQNIFNNIVVQWPEDVHVVHPQFPFIRNDDDEWFFLIYYYSCTEDNFKNIRQMKLQRETDGEEICYA